MRIPRSSALPIALLTSIFAGSLQAASGGPALPAFDSSNFTNPVANAYFPLVAHTVYTYEADTPDGTLTTVTTVTSITPTIDGVTAVEVHDVVTLDTGTQTLLIEDTTDWFAPDNFGNVWYLGESTVEHLYDENWNEIGTTTEGSWTGGIGGAEPGIIMLADPQPGTTYRQEFAAGIAEDMAKVERLNGKVSVVFGDFSDVLVTKEWTPLEPGAVERKYYVAGVGLVLVEEFHGKGTVRQELFSISGP